MISISLFCCGKNVFIHKNTYVIGKNSMRNHFYSHLSMEDITVAVYQHAKRVCKDSKIKNLGEYHDLYVSSDTLL